MSENNSSLQGWFDFFRSMNTYPYCLYGMYSRLGITFSMDGKLQLSFSKVKDANNKSKPEKGVEKYDNNKETMKYFSLSAVECLELERSYNDIVSGKYKNPKATDEKYSGNYTVTHFSGKDNNIPTELIISRSEKDGKLVGLKITVSVNRDRESTISFVLRNSEISLFRNFITAGGYGAVVMQFMKAAIKTTVSNLYTAIQKEKESGGKKSGGYTKKNNYNSEPDDDFPSEDEEEAPKPTYKKKEYTPKVVEESSDDDVAW